jgi:hypothetical protein
MDVPIGVALYFAGSFSRNVIGGLQPDMFRYPEVQRVREAQQLIEHPSRSSATGSVLRRSYNMKIINSRSHVTTFREE